VSVTLLHLLHTLNNIQRRERERERENKKKQKQKKKNENGNNSKNKIVAAVTACIRTRENVYMYIQIVHVCHQ